jgi:hypothetical protein
VTFTSYFQDFVVSKTTRVRHASPPVGTDMMGCFVDKRDQTSKHVEVSIDCNNLEGDEPLGSKHLVRFSDYHPAYNTEGYFYNVLLGAVLFKKESDLLLADNSTGSYFLECRLRGILTSEEDLENHVGAYAKRHLWQDKRRQQLVDKILQNNPFDELPDGSNDPDAPPFDASSLAQLQPNSLEMLGVTRENEFSMFEDVVLNHEQLQTFEALKNAKRLHLLSGTPGAGKSFLTKYLAHHLRKSEKTVQLTATTGAATTRLSTFARTVHKVVNISVEKGRVPPPILATNPCYDIIKKTNVWVIDEMSMMTATVFCLFVHRLKQVLSALEFNELFILLIRDHAQLPAVCKCHSKRVEENEKDFICSTCHISASLWWSQLTFHHLSVSERHSKDPAWLQFFNIIRERRPTQEEIDHHLGPCFVGEAEAIARLTPKTTSLCTHNIDVRRLNGYMLRKIFQASEIVQFHSLQGATPKIPSTRSGSKIPTSTV